MATDSKLVTSDSKSALDTAFRSFPRADAPPFHPTRKSPGVSNADGNTLNHGVNIASHQRVGSYSAPIPNTWFIPPPPIPAAMRPYGPPVYNDPSTFMRYPPVHHHGSLGHTRMVPFVPMFSPMPDPHLPSKIVRQIDYYFSDDNLAKDVYLRQKMDVDGWVPIDLIANFNKIKELTDIVPLILDALRASNVVEIQGDKVRKKGNWRKWILTTLVRPAGSSPPSLHDSGGRDELVSSG